MLLHLYHLLPYPLKTVLASGRGLYLRQWRYSPETERLVSEARERETWSRNQWRQLQEKQLAALLHRAATKVPFYRKYWNKRRAGGDKSTWELLENWPVLDKEQLRSHPKSFLAEDCNPAAMYRTHTSGTTGTPIDLWWSLATSRQWYALFETRWRRWHGVNRYSRWAILGGQLVTKHSRCRPPFWVWNQAFHQLYMSVYHLSPQFIPSYLEALKKYRIEYLWGYTSALHTLAREAIKHGLRDLKMKIAMVNAEPLWEHQRDAIENAFQCPVRETYGMTEIVAAAGECENGKLHFWPETGILETRTAYSPGDRNESGEFLCTGLINADMPLIRYRVGDSGLPLIWDHQCDCGRTLPILPRPEGRCDDLLRTIDGREIGRLDPVFKGGLPIQEAQIIQETLESIRVKIVTSQGFDLSHQRDIQDRLRQRLGEVEVIIEKVERIPRTGAGKFRAVISRLNDRT